MIDLILPTWKRDRVLIAEERNQSIAGLHYWGEVVELARRKGWPLPVGGGVNTVRKNLSSGLDDQSSSWMFPTTIADFGDANIAGASNIRKIMDFFPLTNPAHIIKSPDNYPSELPGGLLTAASGARRVGSGNSPIALLVGCWLVHVNAAGTGGFNTNITPVNVRTNSLVTTTGGGWSTQATVAIGTTNVVDAIPISSVAERQVGFEGVLLTTIAALFNADALAAEIVAAGAQNLQGTTIAVMAEVI